MSKGCFTCIYFNRYGYMGNCSEIERVVSVNDGEYCDQYKATCDIEEEDETE